MSYTSITQRFMVWFLIISLLPLLLVGYSLLRTFETELQHTVARQIAAIADKKVDQIDAYLDGRVQDALVKTQANSTRLAMAEFARAFAQGGVESDAYRQLDARYREHFKRFIATAGYYDLFLISPQGAVVYTQTHEADFATNLITGPYRNTGLAKVARNALRTLESGTSEFEPYAPSGNAIAAFIAVPIVVQGKVEGVLALQIDNARVFQVLLDDTGLGMSGETVVARLEDERTALLVAPLKSDPDAALKRKIPLDAKDRTLPLMHALNGERGSGYEMDYLGKSVVAAWRYLPRMKWGLVVKMDAAEALAPLYRARTFGLGIVGLAVFAALAGALVLGRRVVIPLKKLSNSAQELAVGKLDQRVPVVGRDELGQLAASFNTMAEHLQSSYADLEGQVRQRTAELTRALAQEQEAQGALRQERDFAAGLVNTAPVIVLLLDPQGIIEYVNPYFEQITGYRLDEVRGKEWFRTFLPARDQDQVRSLFRKAVHGEPTRGNINPIVTRSGGELEIEWYDQAMRDAQGKVISVLATGQDVTARRSMEQALSASVDRMNEAQRSARVGSWELDLQKGELVWSDEIFRLFEIDKGRFGATYEAFLNAIHPDDRDRVNQAYTDSLATRKPYEITHRLRMSDGRVKWVHERCETILDADGKPLRSMGTVQDITERMWSEVEYQTILKTTRDCFCICDLQGRFLDVNDAYCELIGYRREELLAMAIPDVAAVENPEDTRAHVEKVIATGSDRFETLHRRKDGSLVNFEVSANFMPEGGGRIIVFLRDITLRKLEEVALIEAKQSAEAASRAKSEFLANMSHEIRTPMNAILGLTQLVLDTELTPRQQDFLKKTHASARALLGILNDILDYSKIEAGRMEVERVVFDLEDVLENVANLFSARIEEKGLELFFEIAPDTPVEILGDPLRLTQVLNNLVGNAVKFTERGEIHVKVEVLARNHATQRLRFAVRDTGIGLSKAQADRLFQPFTQADGSITRKYGGTGLGLSICQRLIGLMGGEIAISGNEGQGATFTFTIQAGIVEPYGPTPDLQQIHGLHALVVDDRETSRLILRQLLQAWGLGVRTAASGEEALAQIEAAQRNGLPCDVLLLDWRMPGMDGLEVVRRIEQDAAQGKLARPLRVVMVTAHDRESLLENASSLRLDGVLTKPVIPSHLFDTLANLLQPEAAKAEVDSGTGSSAHILQGMRILLVEDNEINQQVAAEFLKLRGAALTLANHGAEAVNGSDAGPSMPC